MRGPAPHSRLVVEIDPVDRDDPLRMTQPLRLLPAQRVPPRHRQPPPVVVVHHWHRRGAQARGVGWVYASREGVRSGTARWLVKKPGGSWKRANRRSPTSRTAKPSSGTRARLISGRSRPAPPPRWTRPAPCDLGSLFSLINISCGAATIANVTDTPQEPIGRHLPPISEDPDYPFPAVPPQSQAVNASTDVITVGVGGNTFGFADYLTRCQELGNENGGEGTPCKDALGSGVQARLDRVSTEYDRMLDVLHERAPEAKILAVGYPMIVPNDASSCTFGDLTQFGTITQGDLAWLRTAVLEPLNQTIEKSTTTQETASFVDLYNSSQGPASATATSGSKASSPFPTSCRSSTPTSSATATPPTTSKRPC